MEARSIYKWILRVFYRLKLFKIGVMEEKTYVNFEHTNLKQ